MVTLQLFVHHYFGRFIKVDSKLINPRAPYTQRLDYACREGHLVSFQEESHKN